MVTKEQAQQLVQKLITTPHPYDYPSTDRDLVVLEKSTIEKPYGWVFFYNSRRFIETGNFGYALGGNGPILVTKETGKIIGFGTAYSIEDQLEKFEAEISNLELYLIEEKIGDIQIFSFDFYKAFPPKDDGNFVF